MPRNKPFKGNRNKFGQQKRDRDSEKGKRGNYDNIQTENALYERFYKESNVVPENEWEEFWSALKRTLPTTFRFTGSKGYALSTMKVLQDTHIPQLADVVWDGQKVDPPKPLPWYPDDLAWGLSVGKTTIRRCPPFKKFQNFLVGETTVGNISRQEAVSMIPPLLMDIKLDHVVLDMCAAPGSKTAQLVEMIHNGEESAVEASLASTESGDGCGRCTGLVIANDSDYKRSHMLIHQTKRLNSPNLIVTNHDATMFPSLLLTTEDEPVKRYLKFDRILADVPCTGDGTARKNYNVWKDWNPHNAFNLHNIQIRILVRGLQMLKVDGRLVYSTCSMNPIENEAVVQAAIDRCGGPGKVEIVDVNDRLPELKRKPGLKGGWRVMDKDERWYASYDEASKDDEGKEQRIGRITKSMFPTEDGKSDDDPTRIPLERCVRVYPHLQDTGGFFITVLRKKEEIRSIKPEDTKQQRIAALRAQQGVVDAAKTDNNEDVVLEGTATDLDAQTATIEPSLTGIHENAAPPTAQPDERMSSPPLLPPPSPGKRKLESPLAVPAIKKLKVEDAVLSPTPESSVAPTHSNSRGKKKGPPPEEPFKYIPPSHPVLNQIVEYYGLSPRFPLTCFMVRNAEAMPVRIIYFTSHLAKLILMTNEGRGVKFVHCGVKAFMKQDVQSPEVCPWRIQSDGLAIVTPWIGPNRIIHAKKRETVHALLREFFPKVKIDKANGEAEGNNQDTAPPSDNLESGEAEKKNAPSEDLKTIDEIQDQVRELGMGCCILKISKSPGEFDEDMVMPLWKSRYSCNLMLPKDERRAMLLRLFDDTSSIVDSTLKNHHSHRDAKQDGSSAVTNMDDAEVLDSDIMNVDAELEVGQLPESPDGGVPLPETVEEPLSQVLNID